MFDSAHKAWADVVAWRQSIRRVFLPAVVSAPRGMFKTAEPNSEQDQVADKQEMD